MILHTGCRYGTGKKNSNIEVQNIMRQWKKEKVARSG